MTTTPFDLTIMPLPVDPIPDFPAEPKSIPAWVGWKLVERDGKQTKPLFIAGTDRYAKVNDPSTWTTFENAIKGATINGEQGIGFVLSEQAGYVGIDVDGCRNPKTGEYAPWLMPLLEATNSYAENTPSGTGVRIWVKGVWTFNHVFELDPAAGFGGKVKIEVYGNSRYFTTSGKSVYEQTVGIKTVDLAAVLKVIQDIQKAHPAPPAAKAAVSETMSAPTSSSSVPFGVIQFNGTSRTTKYELLMNGEATGDKPTTITDKQGNFVVYAGRSEADQALASVSAIHHKDAANITDAVWDDYKASCLYREEEWGHREEYFKTHTIAKAIKGLKDKAPAPAQVSVPDEDDDAPFDPLKVYDMTAEEIAAQEEAEYPVYKLKETAGPQLDDVGLYGTMGEVAKMICKHSEAHVATVYLNLLVTLGNMFGRSAYFNVGSTKHYTNENLANIGETSIARKGTSSDAAESFLRALDSSYMSMRNMGGFSSPQAVIDAIKDASSFQKRHKTTGEYKTVFVPGVDDKRLLIRENELSNLFKLIADTKTKAAELFRNAFDGKPISNLVAGKTEEGERRSMTCREPMISIIGSSTRSLIQQTMPYGSDTSGDGNRIIWNLVKRTQLCPRGGPDIDWASVTIDYKGATIPLMVYMQDALNEAYECGLVNLTRAAWKYWDHLYHLNNAHKSALWRCSELRLPQIVF